MSINLKYLETIELPCKLVASYSCEISENGYISVATTSALYIYQIYSARDNSSPSLCTKKFSVPSSSFTLSSNVGLDVNTFLHELPQHYFYEGVLSTELSAKLIGGTSVEEKTIRAAWSPPIINEYDCVLATLSNTGSLEIIVKVHDTTYYEAFKAIFNLTEKYTEMCRDTWRNSSNMTPLEKYNELKYRIKETLPTAFTWSNKIDESYCVLIVGHACGDISFWKVNTVTSKKINESDINFMNVINANVPNINTMQWISAENNNALLIVGNCDGVVNSLKITSMQNEQVVIAGELQLWTENDQITVKDIKMLTYLSKHYTIITKGSELIILLFDEDAKKIDCCRFHAGNVTITGVQVIGENTLLIVCLSGAIKEVVINCVNSKINIEWRHLYVNINWYIYQALSLITSINKTLFIFLTGPCKSADNKEEKDSNSFVVFLNTAKDPLEILSTNQSSNFGNYWDCLEAFRCQSLIDKQLQLKSLKLKRHYDSFSLYELKILLLASKLSELIYEQTGNISVYIKPSDDIFQIFSIKMATNRILYLLKLYETKKTLTLFQLHNIFILNCYLKQVVADDLLVKFELGENIVDLLLNVILRANMVDYTSFPDCLYCEEKLIGVSCLPPHFDMRCSISFMQVSKYPDYKCLLCGSIAHIELEKEFAILTCPFCDIPMCKRQ